MIGREAIALAPWPSGAKSGFAPEPRRPPLRISTEAAPERSRSGATPRRDAPERDWPCSGAKSGFAPEPSRRDAGAGPCQSNLYVHLAFLSNKKGFFRLSKDLLNISYVLSGKSCEKDFEKLKSTYPKHF